MNTLDEFFEHINRILMTPKFEGCAYPIYRGHSKGTYRLVPTLIRDYHKTDKKLSTLENNLYCDFKALVGPRVKFDSSWEILYAMRHEGIPTRLLDWTENIGTALFFALESNDYEQPHIWILNPYSLNEKNEDVKDTLLDPEEDLDGYDETYADFCNQSNPKCHDLPIVIYPRRTNERIFAQRGLFTIHGLSELGIEDTCSDCVERVDIPINLVSKVKHMLKQFGINQYSVYPDFKGLQGYLKEIYKY